MRSLRLTPELLAALDWLRAVQDQSWRAPAPPPWPLRPVDNPEAQAFYDFAAPIYARTAQVWASLAAFRAPAPEPTSWDTSQFSAP